MIDQEQKSKSYDPVIPYSTYVKSAPRSPNTGFEMTYPKPPSEAQKIVEDILKIIKEEVNR